MHERVDAIFENGVFRPEVPVTIANGQRVSLEIETKPLNTDELRDVADLLDAEFVDSCRNIALTVPTLHEVRQLLSAFDGSLSDRISEERDER